MTSNKFEHARFFNVELATWQKIETKDYRSDVHHGKLVCPNECCNGAIKFTSAHTKNANNTDVDAFLSTNGDGETHNEQCPHNPDPKIKNVHRMRDLLLQNKNVIINLNFTTSFSKEKSKLKKGIAKEAMNRVGGFLNNEWKKENKGQYGIFSASSIEQMIERIRTFKEASKGLSVDSSQLKFAYLHGLVSWSNFYSRDSIPELNTNSASIFKDLYVQMIDNEKDAPRFWRGFPALKKETQLFVKERTKRDSELDSNFNKSKNSIEIDGNEFLVKDVISVTDSQVRDAIQSAKTFNFVATPYIQPKDVRLAIERGYKSIPLHWPITSMKQVITN